MHICWAGHIISWRQQSSGCRLEVRLPVQAASVAVEALANLMAGSSPGREAVRAAGGVPVLVALLDAGPWKDVTERATAAIAELVHTCPENQSLVSSDSRVAAPYCRACAHLPRKPVLGELTVPTPE